MELKSPRNPKNLRNVARKPSIKSSLTALSCFSIISSAEYERWGRNAKGLIIYSLIIQQ